MTGMRAPITANLSAATAPMGPRNNNDLAMHTIIHTNFAGWQRKHALDFQRFRGAAALQS